MRRSRTESITSIEESADEGGKEKSGPVRPPRGRGTIDPAMQGHRPSRGEPDYSYARPVKKGGPPPAPLSSTEDR